MAPPGDPRGVWMATLVDDVVAAFVEIARAVEAVEEAAAAAAVVEATADADAACEVCLVACWVREGACWRKELKKEERKKGRCEGIVLLGLSSMRGMFGGVTLMCVFWFRVVGCRPLKIIMRRILDYQLPVRGCVRLRALEVGFMRERSRESAYGSVPGVQIYAKMAAAAHGLSNEGRRRGWAVMR